MILINRFELKDLKAAKKMKILTLILGFLASEVLSLYDSKSDVVELTASNFQSQVIGSDDVWIVEFYAPWCGHCKQLAPEYVKAAKALKGIVKVGGVDMDQHQSVGAPYNVRGFPTLKVFGLNKQSPSEYQGQRNAQGIMDAALAEVKKLVNARLSGKSSGGKKPPPTGDSKDVVELTDGNFEELVLNSKDIWLVEFFAPWCGHCKNLEPQWKSAATALKGKVKLGALDATVHTVMAGRYNVRGFPTIKYFPPGKKSQSDAEDYTGGRTASDIISWAEAKAAENVPPPEVVQVTDAKTLKDSCEGHQLCVISILPHILDCQSKCRNEYIKLLKSLGEKFRKNLWGWVWAEAGAQPDLEDGLGVGGFGYPALAALNSRKMKFATLRGSFSFDGIHEFLRDLSYGKGSTSPLKGAELPKIVDTEKWDGKDGQPPEEEEIDLSDVDLDEKIEL